MMSKEYFSGNKKLELFPIVGVILVIIFYLAVIIKYSVNAPIWDEYYTVLEYFNHFLSAETLWGKIKIFFTNQHNGHRLYLNNILLTAYYYLFGTINFKVLTIIGNLFLIGLFLIFRKCFLNKSTNYLLLPTICLLVNFQYCLSSIMEIASIEFFGAFFLIYASLYFIDKGSSKYFIWSILFGLLGFYTCAHGILLGPIGALLLLLYKRWKSLIIWALLFTLMTTLYLKDLRHGWGPKPVSITENLFCNTNELFTFFIKLLGSPFYIFGDVGKVVLIGGFLISLLIGYLFYQLFKHKKYLLLCGLSLIVGSLFLVSIGRLQLSSPFEYRFRLYSSILYTLIFISFFTYREKKLHQAAKLSIQVIGLLYFSFTYTIRKDYLKHFHEYVELNKLCYKENPETSYGYRCPSQKDAIKHIYQASQNGYYDHHPKGECPVKISNTQLADINWTLVENTNDIHVRLDYEILANNIRFKGAGFHRKNINERSDYFIVLTLGSKRYVYRCKEIMNRNYRSHQKIGYDFNGYEKIINTDYLTTGNYKIGLILKLESGKYYYKQVNQSIQI